MEDTTSPAIIVNENEELVGFEDETIEVEE